MLLLLLIIAAGLLSRKIAGIPLMAGDVLYAVMMYVLVSFFCAGSIVNVAMMSICICFAIEISQLWRAPWLLALRQTTLGKLVLGQGFVWSDLAAYTLGVLLCIAVGLVAKRYKQRLHKNKEANTPEMQV
ncbi:DUF2809 domain-containing protein [Pontibacter sp. E15-1]|uniref:ribosomal maturation YjgA family protein n=1 Tax=Pontibacter sp. E15-1 TaxID=2919918 RepID=UPI001F4F4027|nr:DUF2809 domain-containing protein [Pontibacter sp. E15-1]MCJ8164628.1 DUF2809 domain-containing protein [Pontibacter sp. E15-1]